MWMSVIVYATTTKVLVPLLGLGPGQRRSFVGSWRLVTVTYTSMGGLRAVVITDLIQSAILFGAAIVTIVTVTVKLGGGGLVAGTVAGPLARAVLRLRSRRA